MLLQITINSYYIKKNHTYIDNYKFIMYINILMTLIVNYIIVYGLYFIYIYIYIYIYVYMCVCVCVCVCVFVLGRIGSDIIGSDRISTCSGRVGYGFQVGYA